MARLSVVVPALVALCVPGVVACSSSDGEASSSAPQSGSATVPPPGGGEAVYSTRIQGANTFTCSTCHALEEPAADFRRPGHPIGDATRRPSFKNGKVASFREAVNTCLTEWMNADPWTAEDERYKALFGYLDARAGAGAAKAIEIQRVDPPAELDGGDADKGLATFNQTCAVCHGKDAVGTEKAPSVSGRGLDPKDVATRVRTSGRSGSTTYPGLTGGIMPFWGADRLSDAELVDIVAFLAKEDAKKPDAPAPGVTDFTTKSCEKTHARVGATATLAGKFHGVAGTAHVIDDCTVELRDFAFDGNGIDVRVYGGNGGSFAGGFVMGQDLRRAQGYAGATVRVNLPDGKSLDDLDAVSIWCVPAGVDFGSGSFDR